MTFSLTLEKENGNILKTIVNVLSEIINETDITISPKEFYIEAMDYSRISLLRIKIPKTGFFEYKCPKKITIGINLEMLDKILARSSKTDELNLSLDDTELVVKMRRDDQARVRTFKLKTLDLGREPIDLTTVESIEYLNTITMSAQILNEAIKDAEIYSEVLDIQTNEKGIKCQSVGQMGEMIYDLDKELLIDYESSEISQSSYSTTFLKNILKLSVIAPNVKLKMKTDHPLKIEFDIESMGGECLIFLAPRVEEADFNGDSFDDEFYISCI